MKPIYQLLIGVCLFGLVGELQAAKYRIERSYPHGGPFLGKETIIRFSIFRGSETTPLKASEFQLEHEKLIHLMTVDSGFQEYLHEHPVEVSDGIWEVPVTIKTPGNYRFYLQFLPEDEITTKLVTFDDRFVTDPSQVVPTSPMKPAENLTFTGGEFKVTLNYLNGKPEQKKIAEAYFTIEKNGVVIPFKDLDLYLGTQMHIAGISADKTEFVHTHPGEGNSNGDPDAKEIIKLYLKQSGYYGLFMQFQYKGVVHTSQFALQVKAAQ